MKLTDFDNAVSRRVDTDKTAISVAETKRALSEAFLELAAMDTAEFADTVSKGVAQAERKWPGSKVASFAGGSLWRRMPAQVNGSCLQSDRF